jgi:hypothetical protein
MGPQDGFRAHSCSTRCRNLPTAGSPATTTGGDRMKRRDFVLATAILAGAARAAAQQPERMRRIGVLQQGSESDPESQRRRAAFVDGLQEFGWTEGTNVLIDYRWVGDDADRMRLYATELTSTRPDVICANSSLLLLFLMRATRSIPIVFTQVYDPVLSGFVTNLNRPGGKHHWIHAGRVLSGREATGGAQGGSTPGEPCGGHSESCAAASCRDVGLDRGHCAVVRGALDTG